MQVESHELESLLQSKGVSTSAIARAHLIAANGRTNLLRALNQMGELQDDTFAEVVSVLSNWPILRSSDAPDEAIASALSKAFMRARREVQSGEQGGLVDVGFVNPLDSEAVEGVRFALGPLLGKCVVVQAAAWKRAFSEFYDEVVEQGSVEASVEDQVLSRIFDQDRDAPVARKVAGFLTEAVSRRASDIHIEARRNQVDVRMRVDGRLQLFHRSQSRRHLR